MKKITALLMTVILVVSLCSSAFAGVWSPVEPLTIGAPKLGNLVIRESKENEDDPVITEVPEEDIHMYSVLYLEDPEMNVQLPDGVFAPFKAAFDEAKAVEDKAVKYLCWLELSKEYQDILDSNSAYYLELKLFDSADDLDITMNGVEVSSEKSESDYTLKLYELGAMVVYSDVEE